MPTPKPVSKKLEEVMGEEVGGSMSGWLDGLERRTEELRLETQADIAEVRQEVHAVREEMRVGLAKLEAKVDAGFAKVDAAFAKLGEEMATKLADNLKWMFGIWIASFVALVGVLAFFRGAR